MDTEACFLGEWPDAQRLGSSNLSASLIGLVSLQDLSELTDPKSWAQAIHATLSRHCLTSRSGHCEEGVHTSVLQLQVGVISWQKSQDPLGSDGGMQSTICQFFLF